MRLFFLFSSWFFGIILNSTAFGSYSNLEKNNYKTDLLTKQRRTDLINFLIVQNNYTSYLEIGIADGTNFREIIAPRKVGVDPVPGFPGICRETSDSYFSRNSEMFDIIFIDGLHLHEQVLKDVFNSLAHLNENGIIIMHDCMPFIERHQVRNPPPGESWNGDVWKAIAHLRMYNSNLSVCVLDMDCGCGIINPRGSQELFPQAPLSALTWAYYVNNKQELLKVKKIEDWLTENNWR